MRKILIASIIAVFLAASAGVVMAKPAGYNWKALVFVGTGMQWCEQKLGTTDQIACEAALGGPYTNDHLVMKWSYAWQMAVFGPNGIRYDGDEADWSTDAWLNNNWNGMFPGGSGELYSSKIVWVGTPCDSSNSNWRPGGYCIWGAFEVIHEQGKDLSGHWWAAHGIPSGYGR